MILELDSLIKLNTMTKTLFKMSSFVFQRESQIGLQQHKAEQMMTEFSFLDELSL